MLVLQDLVHQGVLNKMTDRTPIESVIDALPNLFHLNIRFDQGGTRITYYDQSMIG